MSLSDWLAAKLGTRQWLVAARLTDRMRARGYTVAISRKRFATLKLQHASECGPL